MFITLLPYPFFPFYQAHISRLALAISFHCILPSKMSKIDQIHLRAVMLCMSKGCKDVIINTTAIQEISNKIHEESG